MVGEFRPKVRGLRIKGILGLNRNVGWDKCFEIGDNSKELRDKGIGYVGNRDKLAIENEGDR